MTSRWDLSAAHSHHGEPDGLAAPWATIGLFLQVSATSTLTFGQVVAPRSG